MTDAARGRGVGERRTVLLLALGCAVALALLVAGAVVAVTSYTARSSVAAESQARAAASLAARRFVQAANNYSSAKADAYQARVFPMLTTRYQQDWRSNVDNLRTYEGEEGGVQSSGTVLDSAVVAADLDSATVLVVADTRLDVAGQGLLGALRWQVSLFDVDGRWLVDDYQRIGPGGISS